MPLDTTHSPLSVDGVDCPHYEVERPPMWKRALICLEAKDAALTLYFDKRPWATKTLFAVVVVLGLVCASLLFVVVTSDYGERAHSVTNTTNQTLMRLAAPSNL